MDASIGIFALLFLVFGVVGLLLTVFWIWMLIDCAMNEPSQVNDKLIWILVIALTGATGGQLAELADVAVRVPATRTLEVQEYHLPVYHALALMLEASVVDRSGVARRG